MNRTTSIALRASLLATIALVAIGCVSFTEPVTGEVGEIVDLGPFVGTWSNTDGSPTVVELSIAGENLLSGQLREPGWGPGDPTTAFTVTVTRIGGRTVASATADESVTGSGDAGWAVFAIDVDDEGSQMVLTVLDQAGIIEALEAGTFSGDQLLPGEDYDGFGPMMIETDGASLRAYLEENPAAFTTGEYDPIVITRGEPDSYALDEEPWVPESYPYPGYTDPEQQLATLTAVARSSSGSWATPTVAMAQPAQVPAPPPGDASVPQTDVRPDEPLPVTRLIVALAVVLFAGVVVAIALDYVTRRNSARVGGADAMDAGSSTLSSAASTSDTPGTSRLSETLHRNAWPAVLIVALAVGPILFLSLLLRGIVLPGWVPGAQAGAQSTVHDFAPYLLVFTFGALIGIAEVVNTYPRFPSEALSTKWGTLLVLLNASGTTIAYAVVMAYASAYDHPLLRAFGVAAGFAIVIRTRFYLARDLGGGDGGDGGGERGSGGGGISVDFGWLYTRFQHLCRQRIDRDLLRDRRYAIHRLLELNPDTASLVRLAVHTTELRADADPDVLRERLDALQAEDLPEGIVRARIAGYIVDTAGLEHAAFLIEHSAGLHSPGPSGIAGADASSPTGSEQ